jgi:ubiquinone/menaquinone biosynthesis C-methylase UbiE
MPHEHVCPWYMGYFLASPLRRLMVKPEALLKNYVREGTKALEIGPGMGFFTIPLARMVGPAGRVVAIDIQQQMLNGLMKRARKAGVAGRIECRLSTTDSLGIDDLTGSIDFAFAFAVVHEIPDQRHFFKQLALVLKKEGRLFMADPTSHFTQENFRQAMALAENAGFCRESAPQVWKSHAAIIRKK